MQRFDPYSYFNGLCAAFYFLTCLTCGLQLCFNLFRMRTFSDTILSRVVGTIFLFMSCGSVCYIISDTVPSLDTLWTVGVTIDLVMFSGIACVAHILYSNDQPSPRILAILSLPFVFLAIAFIFLASWMEFVPGIAMLILIADYAYYGIAIRKREHCLDDIYANPDSHSLRWIYAIITMLTGWLTLRYVVIMNGKDDYYDIILYLYMTGVVTFAFNKVLNYGVPVSLETQEQIENARWSEIPNSSDSLKDALKTLLVKEQIYLNHNLTIENVASRLGTTPLYFSGMLHNDMQTTFSRLINQYRIEKAKVLLASTNDKIEYIAHSCGFNSTQVFNRTFIKFTGQTPSQCRNSLASKD